ncbi:MAG: DUF4292 domain-containing protein [Dysgonamonadaceae bacterium]|jgi:hypothetical protein|nr:DUF4292 domain-containing protein [Dysgonamonadaceae bacterium]
MTGRNRHIFLISLFSGLLILGLNACKSSKTQTQTQIALPEKNKNERLDMIINQTLQFETFSSNLNFTFKSGKDKSLSVDGNLKMIRNQAIQLSLKIPLLGTEAFRMTLTPSQIVVIDRINKQYLSESMDSIKQKAPFDFDFYSFQALLSNQLFIAGKDHIAPDDYSSFRIEEDSYFVNIENTDTYNTRYAFTSDYTNRIINAQVYKEEWSGKMLWIYENFGLTDNKRLFPMTMKMELNLPDNNIQMNLLFKAVNIDHPFELDSKYPSKYSRVSLRDIVKMIKI